MTPFLGEIVMFGGNFAPRGWAFCEGQLLPISQNQALFSILGTIYGGDGRTTFALPDLRGRVPIGPGTGPGLPTYRQGARGGQYEVTLNTNQIPAHSHTQLSGSVSGTIKIGANTEAGTSSEAADQTFGDAQAGGVYNNQAADEFLGAPVTHNLTPSVQLANTGGSQPHNNMQPYLACYYIIALQGTFPSRS